VEVIDVVSADEDEPNQQDSEDKSEWDDLEFNTEDDETQIKYHSNDDDDNVDVEGISTTTMITNVIDTYSSFAHVKY